jgi:membrane-bound lytic murein transglycosylase D
MLILRNFSLLFLLILTPSFLFAAERASGNEVAAAVQSSPSAQDLSLEQDKAPGEQRAEHAAEVQNPPPPKPEASQPILEKENTALIPYASNPVAAKAVDRSISLFAERLKERFSLWLRRSGKYLELMREIMKGENIPEDIAFLPLIESGFNPNAYSVARAVGPWQFIASTGKRYGLKIDWWRDERKDPVKSTHAAASYLKDLYEMFGSWNLAMAAYNAGEGKILKALNRSKSDDYWDLLSTRYIKNETKEYVPRFIAAKMIAMDPGNYGFVDQEYHPPFSYDEVVVDKPVDLDVAADCAGTTVEVIRELNPELRRWSTPPNVLEYTLRIPYGRKDLFMENLAGIPDEERFSIASYTVKKGDTLKKISAKTGIPANVILDLNDEKGLKSLKAGKIVSLPPKEKFSLDRDDKAEVKKTSGKTRKARAKKPAPKKIIVTSFDKKQSYVND